MIPREQCWRWQRSPSQHTEKSKQFQTSHIPIIKLFKAIFATGNFSMAVFCFKVLGSLRHVIWLFASPWFLNPLKYPLRNRMPIIFMQKKCLFLFLSPPDHVQSLFLYTLKELCHWDAYLQKTIWSSIYYDPILVQIYYSDISGSS